MSRRNQCMCLRCRFCSTLFPVLMITIGLLFLAGQFTSYGFGDLWPVILIVMGIWKVIEFLIPDKGHVAG